MAEFQAHPYFATFEWDQLVSGTMKAPVAVNAEEINAPSAKDIEAFKPPEGVEWGVAEEQMFSNWNYTSRLLWQEEAIERIKRKKDLGNEQGDHASGCCTFQ